MSQGMLGISVHDARGVVSDLLEKLGGPNGEEWLTASKRFLRKENPWDGAVTAFLRDMTKQGWILIEDVKDEPVPVDQLKLVSFLKRGESYVSGETMRERAKQENASLGQCQAEYLLEHQEKIPSEWRNYYLVFPGTVWRAPDGGLGIPYLGWGGDRWGLRFGWLESAWDSHGRLLSPSK